MHSCVMIIIFGSTNLCIGLYTSNVNAEMTAGICPERDKYAPLLSVRESVVTFR